MINTKNRYDDKLNLNTIIIDIVVMLILLTYGMTSNLATIACVVIISISFVFKTTNDIVQTLLVFYPLYNLFKFNGEGISYYNIIIISAVFVLFIRVKFTRRYMLVNLTLFSLVIYLSLNNFFQNNTIGITRIIVDFYIPLLLFSNIMFLSNRINFKFAIYSFSFGLIISSMAGLSILPLSNLSKYVDNVHYRLGGFRLVRLQGLTVNPNYFSLDINLAIASILSLNKGKINIIELFLIAILTTFGIMTLSKTFILTLVITFFIYYTISLKADFKNILGFLIVSIIIAIFMNSRNHYILSILDRFNGDMVSIDTITSSRWSIWNGYIEYIFSNLNVLVFGTGTEAELLFIEGMSTHAMHNTYIEIIYYIGIVGGVILSFFLYLTGIKFRLKNIGIKIVPIVTLIVRLFAINIFNREAFMLSLILIGLNLKKDDYTSDLISKSVHIDRKETLYEKR